MQVTSLIDLEINNIVRHPNKKVNNKEYELFVHTPEKDIRITLLKSIETMRDYAINVGDYVLVTFILFGGDMIKDVYPYRNNLELTIIEYIDGVINKNDRYKFVMSNNTANINTARYSKLSREILNGSEQFTIEGQCIDRELEVLRASYSDGIFRSTTVKDVMLSELKTVSEKTSIDGSSSIVDISITEPNNDRLYSHINIPTGTGVLDLPSFLQETDYGVYNGFIGTYLQRYNDRKIIFIYPVYSRESFDKNKVKLMIYQAPNSKYDFVENTFKVDGDIINILATSELTTIDTGQNELIDAGNSIVTINSETILARNSEVTTKSMMLDSESNIRGYKLNEKEDGVNRSVYLGSASNNLYKHRSHIVKNSMAVYQLLWHHCDIDILIPGIGLCFVYEDIDKGIVKLNGTLLSVFSRYDNGLKTTSAVINIAVEKQDILY